MTVAQLTQAATNAIQVMAERSAVQSQLQALDNAIGKDNLVRRAESLMSSHGIEALSQAFAQNIVDGAIETTREQIASSDLPQAVKDDAYRMLDQFAATAGEATTPAMAQEMVDSGIARIFQDIGREVVTGDSQVAPADIVANPGTMSSDQHAAREMVTNAANDAWNWVNNSDLPQDVKNDAYRMINEFYTTAMSASTPAEARAMIDSGMKSFSNEIRSEARGDDYAGPSGTEGTAGSSEGGKGTEGASGGGGAEGAGGSEGASGGGGAEAEGAGGSGEAEGAGEGGGGGLKPDDLEDENGGRRARGGKGGGNMMLQIAAKLGSIQDKQLQKAMNALDAMGPLAEGGGEGGTPGSGFSLEQNKFTAWMQLFGMTSNAASTAMKSLGEGLSGVARKS